MQSRAPALQTMLVDCVLQTDILTLFISFGGLFVSEEGNEIPQRGCGWVAVRPITPSMCAECILKLPGCVRFLSISFLVKYSFSWEVTIISIP